MKAPLREGGNSCFSPVWEAKAKPQVGTPHKHRPYGQALRPGTQAEEDGCRDKDIKGSRLAQLPLFVHSVCERSLRTVTNMFLHTCEHGVS